MGSLLKPILPFFLLVIWALLVIFIEHGVWQKAATVENLLMISFLSLAPLLTSKQRLRFVMRFVGLLLATLIIGAETLHFYFYNDLVSASTMFILFETYSSEIKEFILVKLNVSTVLIGVVFLCNLIFGFRWFRKIYKESSSVTTTVKKRGVVGLLMLGIMVVYIKAEKTVGAYFLPFTLQHSFKEYKAEMTQFNAYEDDKQGGAFSEVTHKGTAQKEVYILVLGEATTRHHMSLYGYYRDTNPRLKGMMDELEIYKDVISPHAHSIPSLQKMLTLANTEHPEDRFKGSLLQLFNKAGFTTYWLSNQRPAGMYETGVTQISKSADKRYFYNTSNYATPFDEVLLKPLNRILELPDKKQLIVIHLMGTHGDYKKRYSKPFDQFQEVPQTIFPSEKATAFINAYDNAVLYNDFIVSKVVQSLKQVDGVNALLYVSDHGEEVFNTADFEGHSDMHASQPMFDIPFVLWRSKAFNQRLPHLVYDTSRAYNSEDLIYTIADLAQIQFKEFQPEKSIFNPDFTPQVRMICDTINYDIKFKYD